MRSEPAISVEQDNRVRLRAGLISLVVALVLLGAKWWAYVLTGSMAVFSDALESIVNVVAAAFAIGGLVFAHEPADRNHPYGHGKIEFFSAAFEGGLIAFAAALILWESVGALLEGPELKQLDAGIWITAAAGVGNAVLGVFLVRTGRKHHSMTLVADGQHVLSDFWTSVGIIAGLGLVWITDIAWLDPVVAIVVALLLLWTGGRLVRTAAAGLLDEEDPQLLDKLVTVLQPHIGRGMIRLHHLRAIRAGRFHHVSAHLVVPEFWTVQMAHDYADGLSARVITDAGIQGELVFHTDPCHRSYCAMCDVDACPVRAQPFAGRPPLTVEEAVRPDLNDPMEGLR